MYIRNTLIVLYLSVFIPNIFESIFCEVTINNTTNIVGNIHMLNSPSYSLSGYVLLKLYNLLGALNNQKHYAFLMGDHNIDLPHIIR